MMPILNTFVPVIRYVGPRASGGLPMVARCGESTLSGSDVWGGPTHRMTRGKVR